jgi:hypothetical protein
VVTVESLTSVRTASISRVSAGLPRAEAEHPAGTNR